MKMDLEQFIESCEKSEEIKFILLKIYEISLTEFKKEMIRIQSKGRSEYTSFESVSMDTIKESIDTYRKKYNLKNNLDRLCTKIKEVFSKDITQMKKLNTEIANYYKNNSNIRLFILYFKSS